MNAADLSSSNQTLAAQPAPATLWPQYRHDDSLVGHFPLRAGLDEAPQVRWSADLGGENTPSEQWRVEDLDGDGQAEVLRILPDQLVCQDLRGQPRWTREDLPQARVVEIRDFAGDGGRGLLVDVNTGTELQTFMVSGATGEKALLYAKRNVFGESRRSGQLLPGVPGQQLCAWWSGDHIYGEKMASEGWVFSFERGIAHPTVRFHVQEEGAIYAPLHLIADMDGDGRAEMVMISHEQLWIYDLETSQRQMYSQWTPHTIRTYWANTAALPLKAGARPSLLMINPHLPGLKVVDQDGQSAHELWKLVIGGKEDQYQPLIKIEGSSPDPFIDLDGDGEIEMLVAITNEHGDGKTWLVIFGADQGERRFEAPDLKILAAEDLDGDGQLEVFLQQRDGTLRLANWTGSQFADRWQGAGTEPLFQPPPPEQELARTLGSKSTLKNPQVWRETPGARPFLMKLQGHVYSWELESGGTLKQLREVTRHPALGPVADPTTPAPYTWDGKALVVREAGQELAPQTIPTQRLYLAPPPLVGVLGGQVRVIVRNRQGDLVSLSPDGTDPKVLVRQSPAFAVFTHSTEYPQLCDVDGDGEMELLTSTLGPDSVAAVVAVDGEGQVKLRLPIAEGATQLSLGPTGRLGAGQGRWIAVRYTRPLGGPYVVAHSGRTGKQLWQREHFGFYGENGVIFALHTPTAVLDYNHDGIDDFLAQSENFYNIVGGRTGKDLLSPMPIHSDVVPGHWTAYATPMSLDLLGDGKLKVFFSRSYQLTAVSDLEGNPFWHWGLTRDTTARNHAGLGDLDGDGKIEIVVSQADGLLTAYEAEPTAHKCPSCPAIAPEADSSRAGQMRWTFRLPPPLSDITTADLDGDGRDELLLGTGKGLCCLKEMQGQPTIAWIVDLGRTAGAPILADLSGKGRPVILISTEDGFLHCLF
ncbi:MAG: VCBS repeat-containing protein [Candidatus Latescibacteria bacterium]|nr:VCBS repeat-containing protein [Candidatus Latescibacterota bacterium]